MKAINVPILYFNIPDFEGNMYSSDIELPEEIPVYMDMEESLKIGTATNFNKIFYEMKDKNQKQDGYIDCNVTFFHDDVVNDIVKDKKFYIVSALCGEIDSTENNITTFKDVKLKYLFLTQNPSISVKPFKEYLIVPKLCAICGAKLVNEETGEENIGLKIEIDDGANEFIRKLNGRYNNIKIVTCTECWLGKVFGLDKLIFGDDKK